MKRKHFIPVLMIAAAGIIWLVNSQPGVVGRGDRSAAVNVEVAKITRIDLVETRRFPASLEPWSQYVVSPKISGRIERLHVDIGDTVKHNDIVAQLDADEYKQSVAQAEAELAMAEASAREAASLLALRKRTLERARDLRRQGFVPQVDLDNAESEFQAQEARKALADAQVAQQRALLANARIRLSYTTLRASWEENDTSRVVGERFIDEGTTVAANTPIVSLIDKSRMRAVFSITERDYPSLNIGQTVQAFSDARPDRRVEGKISRLAPVFDAAARQARGEALIPNGEHRLQPGMFIQLDVNLRSVDNALVAPTNALVRHQNRDGVFILTEAGAKFIPLHESAIRTAEWVQLPDDTPEEAQAVTLGQHLLSNGSEVRIVGGE